VTLKLRDEEVTRLNGELAQLSVSYEDQCQAGEEKDAMILDLQRAAETVHTALERERRSRSRVSCLSCLSPVGFVRL
jgi:hypothetical protein